MRSVRIPPVDWDAVAGRALVVPVKVDWPELRLNEGEIIANAIALVDGKPQPYADNSIFDVVLERPRFGSMKDIVALRDYLNTLIDIGT